MHWVIALSNIRACMHTPDNPELWRDPSSPRWPSDRKVPLWRQRGLSACRTILWQQLGCSIQGQVNEQQLAFDHLSVCHHVTTPKVTMTVILFFVRYWKQSHFQAIDGILKTLETVYGSEKPSLTSAAMRWMYHHSQLKVPKVLVKQQLSYYVLKTRRYTKYTYLYYFKYLLSKD